MIHLVTLFNRHLYNELLDDMFRMRARAAIDEMGWNIHRDIEGRDIDEFDFEDTVYILYLNPDNTVGGCARLNPTTRPHLMSEIFPNLCLHGIPQGKNIYTFSRYLIERAGKTRREYTKTWLLIGQAVNEYCLNHNISQVSWLAQTSLYKIGVSLWKTRPLGLPVYFPDDKKEYTAAISDMKHGGLKKVQRLTKVQTVLGSALRLKDGLAA